MLANCTLAPRKVHGLSRAEATARATELLGRFGLGEHVRSHPDRLSGGQQQRAALVRALCTEPRLLLLDEITAALDPELVGDVLAIVRDLAAAGTTMVLATHEMGFAREIASRVCFLDGGRIVESGPPEQVLGDPVEPRTREILRRVLPRTRVALTRGAADLTLDLSNEVVDLEVLGRGRRSRSRLRSGQCHR